MEEEESNDLFSKIRKTLEEEFDLSIKSLLNETVELDKQAREVAKSFGQGSEFIQSMKVNMTDAVRSVVLLGGGFENILNIQKEVSTMLGRNVILSSDVYEKLFAASEVTGEGASKIVESFRNVGISSFKAVEGMEKVVDVSRKSGVNAQKVSGMVLENMDKMNKFTFQGGVEGMARMAAQAVSLRFNMSQTLDIANDLFNPEKAIDMAAAMQRLGANQSALLDPLRLMDMAQNDPEELQNQIVSLSKQFVNLKKDGTFEILPGARRQLMEIEDAIGLGKGELSKMALGAADLDKKMREIQFKPDMSEDERKMIANMAEIGKSGKYEVSVLSKDEKTGELKQTTKQISQLTDEDREYLKQSATPKTMEQLAREQLDIDTIMLSEIKAISQPFRKGITTSEAATTFLDKTRKGIETIGDTGKLDTLDTSKIRGVLDSVFGDLTKTIDAMISGDQGSFDALINGFGKIENKLLKFGTDAVDELMGKFINLGNTVTTGEGSLSKMLTKLIQTINAAEFPGTKPPTVVPTNDFIIKPNDNDKIYTFPEGVIGGTKLPDLNKLLGMTPQPSMNTMGGNTSPINS